MAYEEHKRPIRHELSVVTPNFVSWCCKLFTCPHLVRMRNIEPDWREVCVLFRWVPCPRKKSRIREHSANEETQQEHEAGMYADEVTALLAGSEGIDLWVADKIEVDWR